MRILLRAAIAALLNAGSPNVSYVYSVGDVIANTNAALASGDRVTMLTWAADFDFNNNAGCPLGNRP